MEEVKRGDISVSSDETVQFFSDSKLENDIVASKFVEVKSQSSTTGNLSNLLFSYKNPIHCLDLSKSYLTLDCELVAGDGSPLPANSDIFLTPGAYNIFSKLNLYINHVQIGNSNLIYNHFAEMMVRSRFNEKERAQRLAGLYLLQEDDTALTTYRDKFKTDKKIKIRSPIFHELALNGKKLPPNSGLLLEYEKSQAKSYICGGDTDLMKLHSPYLNVKNASLFLHVSVLRDSAYEELRKKWEKTPIVYRQPQFQSMEIHTAANLTQVEFNLSLGKLPQRIYLTAFQTTEIKPTDYSAKDKYRKYDTVAPSLQSATLLIDNSEHMNIKELDLGVSGKLANRYEAFEVMNQSLGGGHPQELEYWLDNPMLVWDLTPSNTAFCENSENDTLYGVASLRLNLTAFKETLTFQVLVESSGGFMIDATQSVVSLNN